MSPVLNNMVLFNMWGGPDVGKTVFATNLFAQIKIAGFQAELVREVARNFIYSESTVILRTNQFKVAGDQYEEVLKMARAGFEVAVSESPLVLQSVYARMNGMDYVDELEALLRKLEHHFETYDVFIKRCRPYNQEARVHTYEQALEADRLAREVAGSFWLEVDGNDEGFEILKQKAIELLRSKKN